MSRDERPTTREETGRQRRVPLNEQRLNKLTAHAPEGYVGRWMNDEGNRIPAALQGGWEFMKDKQHVGQGVDNRDSNPGQYTSQTVGTHEDGSPLTAYWMVIKKEWYQEDQIVKRKPLDELENAIKHGKVGQDKMSGEDRSATYVPRTGIKIQ